MSINNLSTFYLHSIPSWDSSPKDSLQVDNEEKVINELQTFIKNNDENALTSTLESLSKEDRAKYLSNTVENDLNAFHYALQNEHFNLLKKMLSLLADSDKKTCLEIKANDQTLLMSCVFIGNIELVEYLSNQGADVNNQSGKYSALSIAAMKGNYEIFNILLNKGANIKDISQDILIFIAKQPDEENNTKIFEVVIKKHELSNNPEIMNSLLVLAICAQSPQKVKVLIDRNVNVNAVFFKNKTPLMTASAIGNLELVNILLESGAKINALDSEGNSPLMLAIAKNHNEIATILLIKGANVNAINNEGRSPLMLANSLQQVIYLLQYKPDIDVQGKEGVTALMVFVLRNEIEIVHCLINHGANLNLQGIKGLTALSLAALHGYQKIFNILLEAGADVNITGKKGTSTLMISISKDFDEMTVSLLKKAADVNAKNIYGFTPLMKAQTTKQIEHLLSYKADIDQQSLEGKTALMKATLQNNKEIVHCLINHKANTNIKDLRGWTALMYSAADGNNSIVRSFVRAGAKVNIKDMAGLNALDYAKIWGFKETASLLEAIAM